MTAKGCKEEDYGSEIAGRASRVSANEGYAKAIEIKNLVKKYKSVTAVNDISLDVYEGEIFGFLGPNGAGKTTTIKTLLGLIFPTAGETLVSRQARRRH